MLPDSYYSFERFRGNALFTEVTVDYLNDYERWMLKQDYSKTTIGIYVRSLRTIFNEAIEDGIIKREKYPFGRRRYQIPTSRNVKKGLTQEDVPRSTIMNRLASRNSGQRISGSSLTWAMGSTPKTSPA